MCSGLPTHPSQCLALVQGNRLHYYCWQSVKVSVCTGLHTRHDGHDPRHTYGARDGDTLCQTQCGVKCVWWFGGEGRGERRKIFGLHADLKTEVPMICVHLSKVELCNLGTIPGLLRHTPKPSARSAKQKQCIHTYTPDISCDHDGLLISLKDKCSEDTSQRPAVTQVFLLSSAQHSQTRDRSK